MKVIYIAGPYRARDNWGIERNIRRAEEVALQVWQMGAVPLCPHTMNRYFQGAVPDHVALDGALELMRRSDAVLLVPGWNGSEGTQDEIAEAAKCNIPVFTDAPSLSYWLEAWETISMPSTVPTD